MATSQNERTEVQVQSSAIKKSLSQFIDKERAEKPVQQDEKSYRFKVATSGLDSFKKATAAAAEKAKVSPPSSPVPKIAESDMVLGDDDVEIVTKEVKKTPPKPETAPKAAHPSTGGKKISPPASKPRRNPAATLSTVLDLAADADDADEEDGSDEKSDSEDRRFRANDDEEPSVEGDAPGGDPFREKDLESEKKMHALMQRKVKVLETDGAGSRESRKLTKAITGMKGATMDKTYKSLPKGATHEGDEDGMVIDYDAEELEKEKEINKMLGDDDDDDDEEENLNEAEKKSDEISSMSSSSLSDKEDGEISNGEEEEEAKPPQEEKQEVKGVVASIQLNYDNLSKPVASPKVSVKTPAVVDRRKVCETQVPKILKLLFETQTRASTASSKLAFAMTSAAYTTISSGVVNPHLTQKTQEPLVNAVEMLKAFTEPLRKHIDQLASESGETGNLSALSPLLPFIVASNSTLVRVVPSVPSKKDCRCVITNKPIAEGDLMNIVIILCKDLTLRDKKTTNKLLYLPTALDFAHPKQASIKKAASPTDGGKKRAAAPPVATSPPKKQKQPPVIEEASDEKPTKAAPKSDKKTKPSQAKEEAKPTNSKEEADPEDDKMEVDTPITFPRDEGEGEEEEEEGNGAIVLEPTDPKERLEQGIDGILVRDPAGFIHLSKMVHNYLTTERKTIEWKAKNKAKPVSMFDPESHLPKMELPWACMTTVGVMDYLFKVEPVAELVRCGKTLLYVSKADADEADQVAKAGAEFNLDMFLRLLPLVAAKRDTVNANFINPGVLMAKTQVKVDDTHVKNCFVKVDATGKAMPGSIDVPRMRFLPRFFAQLLIKEAIYFEPAL